MAKITFVQNVLVDYLGVMSIAALLKSHGHSCDLFIDGLEKDIIKSINKSVPDIVGFPVSVGTHSWALKIAKKIKEKFNVLTLFGGAHATIYPEIIEYPQVDIVCRGEGEYPTLELLDCIEKEKDYRSISNLWFKKDREIFRNEIRPLIQELSMLPLPDRELYYKYKPLRNFPTKQFLASRGCPLPCSFCHNHQMIKIYKDKGKYLRFRNIDNIITEIKEVKARYPLKSLYFADDVLTINHDWLSALLEKYKKEVNLPFSCNIMTNTINENMIKYLSEHCCSHVRMGIETGNEKIRMKVLKKPIKNEQIIRVAGWIKKYNIKLISLNMLGIPGETIDEAIETITFNSKLKPDSYIYSILQPYPKTEIANYAFKKGYVDEITPDKFSYSFYRESILKQDNIRQLVNLHKLFSVGVCFPKSIPIIKKLIKLPPNRIFDLIMMFSYIKLFSKVYNVNIRDFPRIGVGALFEYLKFHWRLLMSRDYT